MIIFCLGWKSDCVAGNPKQKFIIQPTALCGGGWIENNQCAVSTKTLLSHKRINDPIANLGEVRLFFHQIYSLSQIYHRYINRL